MNESKRITSFWPGGITLFIILAVTGYAQEAKAPEKTIKVTSTSALKIRDAQVKAMALQSQIQDLTTQRDQAVRDMQTAVEAAFAEVKVSQADYNLNDQTWELTKKPTPPPAKTPDKK